MRGRTGSRAGFTLAEVLVALALLAAVAAVAAASQAHQRAWLQRAAEQGAVLRLAREQLEVARVAPAPGSCWSLVAAERAAGYDCRVETAPCHLAAAACATLAAAGVPTLRVVARGPGGSRAEVRVASAAPLLGRVLEGR